MTKLELAICEAENNGEIDLDTRDIMLGILNESTAQARQVKKLDDASRKLLRQLESTQKELKHVQVYGTHDEIVKVKEKLNKIWQAINTTDKKYPKVDPNGYAASSQRLGKDASGSLSTYRDHPIIHRRLKSHFDVDVEIGKNSAASNPWRGNSEREPEIKGKYKTTNGLKESVLNESTAYTRKVTSMEKRMNGLYGKLTTLEKMRKACSSDEDAEKIATLDKRIEDLKNQIYTIRRDQHKLDPTFSALTAYSSGKNAAKCISDMKKYKKDPATSAMADRLRRDANFWANIGHSHSKGNLWRNDSVETE